MRFFVCSVFILLLAFSSCTPEESTREVYDLSYFEARGEGQGSTYSVIYLDSLQRNIKPAIDSILEAIDKSMSTYRNDSYISKINKGGAGVYEIDEHFYRVFMLSDSVYKLTGGLFDPTVKPLVNFWAIGEKHSDTAFVANKAELDSVMALVGWGKNFFEAMSLEKGSFQLKKNNPLAAIDFNAVAQGYTVDVIAAYLKGLSIYDFFIELGGETLTKGKSPRGDCWRIGIEKPSQNEEKQVQTVVSACKLALATSGSYRKFTERGGKRYSHAINPLSGYPVEHNLLSISVISSQCGFADALATAVLIMGAEEGKDFLEAKKLEGYFIESADDGKFLISQTDGFGELILK